MTFTATRRQQLVVAVLVVAIVALVAVIVVRLQGVRSGPPRWPQHYYCENGHHWTADLSDKPICPTCGQPAIQAEKYICPKCRKVFIGYETKKLDIGQFLYRLPNSKTWSKTGPDTIKCPYCGHTDNPYEFPKPRWNTDPPVGTVIPGAAPPELPPEQQD